jgi:hypothetical protein
MEHRKLDSGGDSDVWVMPAYQAKRSVEESDEESSLKSLKNITGLYAGICQYFVLLSP